jgi:hypothetical protein
MKQMTFLVFVMVLWLATCSAPEALIPTLQADVPAAETALPPEVAPIK